MICTNCGKEIGDATEQCYFCGSYVKEGAKERLEKAKKQKNKPDLRVVSDRNWKHIILGFFCGLIMSVVGLLMVIFLIRRRDLTLGCIIGFSLSTLAYIVYVILILVSTLA